MNNQPFETQFDLHIKNEALEIISKKCEEHTAGNVTVEEYILSALENYIPEGEVRINSTPMDHGGDGHRGGNGRCIICQCEFPCDVLSFIFSKKRRSDEN